MSGILLANDNVSLHSRMCLFLVNQGKKAANSTRHYYLQSLMGTNTVLSRGILCLWSYIFHPFEPPAQFITA